MAQQLALKPLAASDLYNRRFRLAQNEVANYSNGKNETRMRTGTHLEEAICARCDEGFYPDEAIVNTTAAVYHKQCFVCAQCFRPFPDGVYFEVDGRHYCESDFQVLFAPTCMK
uniref:LIM zinc-binding domain-containing protein n=1 Tax=Plectus sambesii TaxID=2011161 RepID=A0A914UJ26_9BILA